MSRTDSLRDVRHMDKIIYTLLDPAFYKNFETDYRPTETYLRLVNRQLDAAAQMWEVAREGLWYYVRMQGQDSLPTQGWKLHVSATNQSAESILSKTCAVALCNHTNFKFALDPNVLYMMNFKRWPRGQSGKFITLYPRDLPSFKKLMEDLYSVLHDDVGPYILSDKRYKDCKVLYYRYGEIAPRRSISYVGLRMSSMISPSGLSVPDTRTPYFSPPPWAADPFSEDHSWRSRAESNLLNSRYRVSSAISFSNSGGVYLADDRATGQTVVLKEARPYTCFDDLGNDAVTILNKEFELLRILQDTGVSPRPIELFQAWEHTFLVEEHIESLNFRELILTKSPLLSAYPTIEQSIQYYDIFTTIAEGIFDAIDRIHEYGIVFGDLTPPNIRIDPKTYAVRLVDFEGAHIPGTHKPPYIFTLGFKSPASIRRLTQSMSDDFYALASVLLYMMFPIAALSAIREDVFETVGRRICKDIGWGETHIPELLTRLSNAEIDGGEAKELLRARKFVTAPEYEAVVDDDFCDEAIQRIGEFIVSSSSENAEGPLFPTDPFSYVTNSLSLAFGSCGILYVLKKCGIAGPQIAYELLGMQLDKATSDDLPPGLMTGSAGMAWCLWELGLQERAESLIELANNSSLLSRHHSYLYGKAGVGMADLFFYSQTNELHYLQKAQRLAQSLLREAKDRDGLMFWESDGEVHLGLGYGQSGVALFLLRLYQVTGERSLLQQGSNALQFDLSYGIEIEPGVTSFPIRPSETKAVDAYIEVGTAGILKVAMRYGLADASLDSCFEDVYRKYSVFPGLFFGLASCVDVLIDAVLFKQDPRYKELVKRPVAGIRDLFMITFPHGIAVPGDNLFRISCDYATGAAGVLRSLWRARHLDAADFMLDEFSARFPQRAVCMPKLMI